MSRKIKIHCHDDDPEIHKWIKIAFCPDPTDDLLENERIEWVNNNVEFKTFRAVGEAIIYYEETKDYPDILSVDIDCTELDKDYLESNFHNADIGKIPEDYRGQEKNKKRGKDLLRYALNYFPDRVIFYFTGQMDDDEIFYEIIDTSRDIGIKTFLKEKGHVGGRLQKKIPFFYENVAKRYLKDLMKNPQVYRKVKDLIYGSSDKDILEFTILIEGDYWKLKHLLLCCWSSKKQKFEDVSNKLKILLDSSFRIRFTKFINTFDKRAANGKGGPWRHIRQVCNVDYHNKDSFWQDFENQFVNKFKDLKSLNPEFDYEFWSEFEENFFTRDIESLDNQIAELYDSVRNVEIAGNYFYNLTDNTWFIQNSDFIKLKRVIDDNAKKHGWGESSKCVVLKDAYSFTLQFQTDSEPLEQKHVDSFIYSISQGYIEGKISQLATIVCDYYDGVLEFLSVARDKGCRINIKNPTIEPTVDKNYKPEKDLSGTYYRIIFPKNLL